jgi:DNA-binding transcriptional ArsR family regulator
MMDRILAEHSADILKAIAHPIRLAIIELLKKKEMCVGDIVNELGEKQAITSQQLNIMKNKGVLVCRREGAKVFYRIGNKNVIKVLACVHEHCRAEKRNRK